MQTHKEVTKQGETGWGLASCCLMLFSWKCNLFLRKQHQDRFTFIFLLLITAFSMQGRWLPWIHKGWDWHSSSYQPAVNSVLSNSNFPLNLKQWMRLEYLCWSLFSLVSTTMLQQSVSPHSLSQDPTASPSRRLQRGFCRRWLLLHGKCTESMGLTRNRNLVVRVARATPEQEGLVVTELSKPQMMSSQQRWAEKLAVDFSGLNWPEPSLIQCCHLLYMATNRKTLSATSKLGDISR